MGAATSPRQVKNPPAKSPSPLKPLEHDFLSNARRSLLPIQGMGHVSCPEPRHASNDVGQSCVEKEEYPSELDLYQPILEPLASAEFSAVRPARHTGRAVEGRTSQHYRT